jgi:putative SOS response-associated peptidase YedK
LHNRMAVILQRKHYDLWLRPGNPKDAPSPATLPCREHDGLEGRPKVGNVKYETPDSIEPGRSEDKRPHLLE